MTREQHLEWCKKRAIEYAEKGDLNGAWTSMISDLNKHQETSGHVAIKLGSQLFFSGNLNTPTAMIDFINGFN